MNASETRLWTNTQQKLRSFVFRYTKDQSVADDIVQDVFLKVHSRLGQLKDSDKIVGWIFQITRNTITDYFRKKSKAITPDELDWESDHRPLNECVASCLQEMLATLPDKYRHALELTELGNLSQTQLSETLGISYSGAKSRVQRARQLLKKKMDAAYLIKFDAYGNVVVCEDRIPCNCSEKLSLN